MSRFNPNEENFGDAPDNWEIPDHASGAAEADEIERNNARLEVQPGENVQLEVCAHGKPELKDVRVFINGKVEEFEAYSARIEFRSIRDPRRTISDFITFPPEDARALEAYWKGTLVDEHDQPRKGSKAGYHGNKFAHLVQRLGWPYGSGQRLPKEARNLNNWHGRKVKASVEVGRPNANGKVYNQIKPFTYESFDSASPEMMHAPTDQPAPSRSPAGAARSRRGVESL
jgi:hypothetical protein